MTLLNPDADEHSAELARARRRRNRAILTLLSGIVAALVLFEGFFVLRDSQAPKLVTALFVFAALVLPQLLQRRAKPAQLATLHH